MSDITSEQYSGSRGRDLRITDINQGTVEFRAIPLHETSIFRTTTDGHPLYQVATGSLPQILFVTLAIRSDLMTQNNANEAAMIGMANLEIGQDQSLRDIWLAITSIMNRGTYVLDSALYAYPAQARNSPIFQSNLQELELRFGDYNRNAQVTYLGFADNLPLRWSFAVTPTEGSHPEIDYRITRINKSQKK